MKDFLSVDSCQLNVDSPKIQIYCAFEDYHLIIGQLSSFSKAHYTQN